MCVYVWKLAQNASKWLINHFLCLLQRGGALFNTAVTKVHAFSQA